MHPQEPFHKSRKMGRDDHIRGNEMHGLWWIEKKMMTEFGGCGGEWVKEDYEISLLGCDVKALFPNITSAATGKIVREEVERSPMK